MWSPLALATQAATVGQLSDGRFILGIGTGGYGPGFWESVGMPNRPVAVMRDYLTVVRALLAGETVSYDGPALRLRDASLAVGGLPRVPVYLGALGPQMVRLAGELADGALLNWATPHRIAESRRLLHAGSARAGRDPSEVSLAMYIRVCVDDDIDAARQALGKQVLNYGEVLTELETRKRNGEPVGALVSGIPDELLGSVGYFGSAAGAAEAFARLSFGLDEAIVRIVPARSGLEPVAASLEALTPARIRKALGA
jgi:alkanesulfonate monooxygenase SsuD/methylene tetrahydromethanopterin reductase-like flavin-dependent oxidoreductase (luciferase family)